MEHRPHLHVAVRPAEVQPPVATVVMVHGAMDRSASFGRVARHLRAFDVVRYDRRGYGQSAGLPVGTLDQHVDDLIEVIDGRAVCVFGHSIGGVIALIAAQRRPDLVRSVLAYETPMPWAPWWPGHGRTPDDGDPAEEAEAFMVRAIGDHFWRRLPERTRTDRRAEGLALRSDIASVSGSAPFDPAQISVPVLVAAGDDTTWWHARAAQELAAALPDAELRVVAGAQHGVHLSHPAAAAHLVELAAARGGWAAHSQR